MNNRLVKKLASLTTGIILATGIIYGAASIAPVDKVGKNPSKGELFALKAQRSLLVCAGETSQKATVAVADSKTATYQLLNQEKIQNLGTGITDLTAGGIVEIPRNKEAERTQLNSGKVGFALGESYSETGIREKCVRPENEHYLLSGTTKVGATTVLKLINPGEKAITAEITAWSESGKIPQSTSELIAPRSESEVLLEALYPGHEHLAIKVKTGGSGIVAFIKHNLAVGAKSLGTITVPSLNQLQSSYLVAPKLWGIDSNNWKSYKPVLRLFNPSDRDIQVELHQGGKSLLKPLIVRANSILALPMQEFTNIENGIEIVGKGKILPSLLLIGAEKQQIYQAIPALESGSFIKTDSTQIKVYRSGNTSTEIELKQLGNPAAKATKISLKPTNKTAASSEKQEETQDSSQVENPAGSNPNSKADSENIAATELSLSPGIWQWQSQEPIYLYSRREGYLQDLFSDLLPSEITQVRIQVENY